MISIRHTKEYCKDYTKIENYEKAVNDQNEMWYSKNFGEKIFRFIFI